MKNIIIVDTYPSDSKKIKILHNHILQLKKIGMDILLISHLPIPEYIVENVNYYIYDKENFLLPRDRSPVTWFADNKDYINIYSCNHAYTIVKNLYLAINFVSSLKYDNFIFTEYDNEISDLDLHKYQNMLDILSYTKKDLFIFKLNEQKYNFGHILYQTSNFAGSVDFFVNNVKLVKSFEEWCNTYPYSNNNDPLEYIFVNLLAPLKNNIYFHDSHVQEYFNNSEIDLFHTFNYKYSIVYNLDDVRKPLIFLLSIGAKYELIVNNKVIFSNYVGKHGWVKEYFYIDENDTNVKIIVNDELVYEKNLNINNISEIRQYAEKGTIK